MLRYRAYMQDLVIIAVGERLILQFFLGHGLEQPRLARSCLQARRLTEARVAEMTAKYKAGATVYELAAEFGCHRATVADGSRRQES